uniref:Uncharacterized protein n=1 Tax=Sphenodon punctatus TaxID=8508 RepID=A0A8D0GN59_SPHPU
QNFGKYFTECPWLFFLIAGEIFELKAELNNEKKEKRKEAVKKVIAAMTVGKDENFCSFQEHSVTLRVD